MAIVQTIEYPVEHRYFAGFLQHAIDESGVRGSVKQHKGTITLILSEEDPEALERFSLFAQKYLPHSFFLGKIETQRQEREPTKERFVSGAYPIAPCPLCLEEITDPASDRYLDDTVACTHYANEEIYRDEDPTWFSPHYTGNDTVLLTDASKARDLFLLTDEELRALFSVEKPTLRVTVKAPELQALTGKKFLRVKAPYNVKSVLAALNAKESGIETLFFDERPHEPELVLVQERRYMLRDNRISVALEKLHDDPLLNRFLNVTAEAGYDEALGAALSLKHGICFPILSSDDLRKALAFAPFDREATLEEMMEDPTRRRLLENFAAKFPETAVRLAEEDLGLFESIAAILGLEEAAYETLLEKALEFHGNGGLKIDMNFSKEGFDYAAMLGSIMSFRLAETEPHYLAYSVFEAYGDMVVSVLGQLKREFKIDRFILLGDLLGNPVLLSRILSKFQISTPYISTRLALDGE